jgi:hypothetical protein
MLGFNGMSDTNPWLEPRMLISIASWAIGVAGFLFGILSYRWNRRESRLEALGNILEPMVRAAQELHQANDCRRTNEELRVSFPDPQKTPEAALRIKRMYDQYSAHISESHKQFRNAEVEYASRSFRFPDNIVRLVKTTQESLSEYGRLVNEGFFEKADLQFARFRDDYAKIKRVGRSWRLANPFEGIRRRFSHKADDAEPVSEFELTKEEMDGIMELISKRATSQAQNTFAVHPPKKLIDHPEISKSDNIIDQLKDSIFVVRFQDGTSKMLSLVELMVLTYNLIVFSQQHQEVVRIMEASQPTAETHIKVSLRFSISDIMRPEMVKTLLSKIDFAESPSDG